MLCYSLLHYRWRSWRFGDTESGKGGDSLSAETLVHNFITGEHV